MRSHCSFPKSNASTSLTTAFNVAPLADALAKVINDFEAADTTTAAVLVGMAVPATEHATIEPESERPRLLYLAHLTVGSLTASNATKEKARAAPVAATKRRGRAAALFHSSRRREPTPRPRECGGWASRAQVPYRPRAEETANTSKAAIDTTLQNGR
jgi:hypothetical protein